MVEVLTTGIAVVGAVLIWWTRPVTALAVYIAVLCWYPQYLAVSIGTYDLSTARILGLVLLARSLVKYPDPTMPRLVRMDVLVLLVYTSAAFTHFVHDPFSTVVEREGGRFLDTVVPYWAFRYSIRNREQAWGFIRCLLIVSLPLALIGVNQAITGFNPYSVLRAYSPWQIGEQESLVRHGLTRADGSFGEKISFGLFFALMLSLQIGMYSVYRTRPMRLVARLGVQFLGMMSTMSSGPIFAAVCAIGWIASYPMRRAWPYIFTLVLAMIVAVELYSDEHFYNVLTRFALNSYNADYRIGLINEAFGGGMSGHWLLGYGYVGVGPGVNNAALGFNWFHTDLVNIYIGRLATTGLLGVIPLILLHGYVYWVLYRAFRMADDAATRWLLWCVTGGLIGWNIAMMTVSALEQVAVIHYLMFAYAAAWQYILASELVETRRVVYPIKLVESPRGGR